VARRRRDTAVVEVDQRPVGVERALNLGPVQLVLGDLERRPAAGDDVRLEELREGVLAEHGEGHAGQGEAANERAATGGH
jgi:hypothetical protein